MSKACEKFGTPVTGGNVSFYNQSSAGEKTKPVFPTPVIGMLGLIQNKKFITGTGFKQERDLVYLLGNSRNDISSSEYLYNYHGVKLSPAPFFDLDEEYQLQEVMKELIRSEIIQSAHDVSDGGLFVTLFESAKAGNIGFSVYSDAEIRKDAFLFGESQSRVVVSVSPENEGKLAEVLAQNDVAFSLLGETVGNQALVDNESYGTIAELEAIYEATLPAMMKQE
jgi:phosphoribosylformylglycinamidine synthase subunit PurL